MEVDNCSITNGGLKQLAVLKLQCVKILGTSVTGDGLGVLRDWPQLADLAIDGTQASAFGVNKLGELRQLKRLDIYSATGKHLEAIQSEMPNCSVNLFP